MIEREWNECLAYTGLEEGGDYQILCDRFDTRIVRASPELSRKSVQYVVTLPTEEEIFIGVKRTREKQMHYWKNGILDPDMPLEYRAVVAEMGNAEKTGWVLDDSLIVDYYLFTYAESPRRFLVPARPLRDLYRTKSDMWLKQRISRNGKLYSPDNVTGARWSSFATFIPGSYVVAELDKLRTMIRA